jgi:hypothetical protein
MLKKYSKYKDSLAKILEPVIVKLYNKIKKAVEAKPRMALVIMFLILFGNSFFVFRYLKQEHKKLVASTIAADTTKAKLFPMNKAKLFSDLPLSKFFEIRKFKDSLEYFRNKKSLNHEDSIALINLLKSYEIIDPNFFKELKSASILK